MSRDFVRSMPFQAVSSPSRLYRIHLDPWLLTVLAVLMSVGLLVLWSASHQSEETLVNQAIRLGIGVIGMVIAGQLDPRFYLRWAPYFYVAGIVLLVLVLASGVVAKGSRRWLEIPGLPRFQPSEMMKIAVPLVVAWYFQERRLPPRFKHTLVAVILSAVPAALIVMQPDLGTGLLVASGGLGVLLMSGLKWRWIAAATAAGLASIPAIWPLLHAYQKERILTVFNPERDPLGAGWNIIQSKTAIGSGGFFGKGLTNGTQSQLDFLPESQTDFIIAVIGEELGLVGLTVFLVLYLVIIARGLFIATQAPDTFGRLVVGGLTLVFFAYVFVNVAMVSGLLPVVGVPLPLVSFGGTSAITLLVGFGIIMSIHTHQNW